MGPRGLSRYRNAVMVGAGGLACAGIGAFFGGLGGTFTVNPAAAHSVASSSAQDRPLAAAVNEAYRSSAHQSGSAAVAAASFSALSGSLTQGIGPFQTLSYHPPVNLPLFALPLGPAGTTGGGSGVNGISSPGRGSGSGSGTGTGSSCAAGQSDLGLSCILDSLTSILGNLGNLQGYPMGALNGLMPTLSGVVADVTGTLSNLSSLLSSSGLPLPTTGLPTTGLPTTGAVPVTGSIPAPTGGRSGVQGQGAGGLNLVLNGIAAAVGGSTGSTTPPLPSLPLPSVGGSAPGLSSLPLTAPGGSLPAPPTVGTPSGGQTTVNVPLPTLPVPVNPPTISIGGISVGVSTGGSNSGLTLTLP